MSTAARARVVQDQVLAEGATAAETAVYGSTVTVLAELCGEPDADSSAFPDDAVLQAAQREVSVQLGAAMGDWVGNRWGEITADAAVLDALDEVSDALLPIPAGAIAYRRAAEDLALRAGDTCAGVAWAGAAAIIEFTRLYTNREAQVAELMACDPVAAAAFRELTLDQLGGVRAWVHRNWAEIDSLATERAA